MFEVTAIDEQLVLGVKFALDAQTVSTPRDGPVTVPGKGAGVIPFQFPPRVTGDSKDNRWETIHQQFAWEPIKMWDGSNARKISISAVYIATGATTNGVIWNPRNIALTTRAFKQYFYGAPGANVFPVVELVLYDHVPTGAGNAKFRMMNVNIKPGKEIISVGGTTFSLRTEVTFTLEQVTRITKKDEEPKIKATNLPEFPIQAWY